MTTHWTYEDVGIASDLSQGDILARTPQLVAILRDAHAHFCDEKYLGFLVVTQSCDLVRRKGHPCNAHYLCLAVIRDLRDVIVLLLDELCGTNIPGVYERESQARSQQLVERILHQNEQSLGLFYLHPDSDAGISVPSIALLRVTISLRREHYCTLVDARQGRLAATFSEKLGWLAGNLYSRVATPDWRDHAGGEVELKSLMKSLLLGDPNGPQMFWAPRAWLKTAKKDGIDFTEMRGDEAYKLLELGAPKPPKQVAIERVQALASSLFGEGHEAAIAKLATRLANDQDFVAACRAS